MLDNKFTLYSKGDRFINLSDKTFTSVQCFTHLNTTIANTTLIYRGDYIARENRITIRESSTDNPTDGRLIKSNSVPTTKKVEHISICLGGPRATSNNITSSSFNERYVQVYQTDEFDSIVTHFNKTTRTVIDVNIPNAKTPCLFYNEYSENEEYKDVFLFYIRVTDSILCFRKQSDNFSMEYETIKLPSDTKLVRVGFTSNNRVQIQTGGIDKYINYAALLDWRGLPILTANGQPIWVVNEIY